MTQTKGPFSVLVEDCYFTRICSYSRFSWTNFNLPWKFAGEIRIPSPAYLSISIEGRLIPVNFGCICIPWPFLVQ